MGDVFSIYITPDENNVNITEEETTINIEEASENSEVIHLSPINNPLFITPEPDNILVITDADAESGGCCESLLGGTENQLLAKASNAPYDFKWVDNTGFANTYDSNNDGIVDRADFADNAQQAFNATYVDGKDINNYYTKAEVDSRVSNYVFYQNTPSYVWTITHNLDKYPNVIIIDSAGSVIDGSIRYMSLQQVQITFNRGFSGTARLS